MSHYRDTVQQLLDRRLFDHTDPDFVLDTGAFADELEKVTLALFALHPCHVTGEHTPDHHLTHEGACSLQAREMLLRALKELDTEPHKVRRVMHLNCYWCGTQGPDNAAPDTVAKREQQRAWLRGEIP